MKKTKLHRVTTAIAAVLIAIMPLSMTAQSPFSGGSGTREAPYQIATAADLAKLAELVNGEETAEWNSLFYTLTADIDLSTLLTASFNDGKGWIPIGTMTRPFRGLFEGNEFAVKGLTINDPGLEGAGLFGSVTAGVIGNLGVENVNISGSTRVGGITGNMASASASSPERATIVNCYVTGTLVAAGNNAGGLVGSTNVVTIQESYAIVDVTGVDHVGGIVGQFAGDSSIVANCYTAGSVKGNTFVGGIAGRQVLAVKAISNNFTTATIEGSAPMGGILGQMANSPLGRIENNVVLSERIIAASVGAPTVTYEDANRVNRILGTSGSHDPFSSNNLRMANNHAFDGVILDSVGVETRWYTLVHDTSWNGADATKELLNTAAFWRDVVGLDPEIWTMLGGQLPILAWTGGNQTGTMPDYLYVEGANIRNAQPTVEQQPIRAWVENGVMYMQGLPLGQTYRIFTVNGQLVHQGVVTSDVMTWRGTVSGTYIIQAGERAGKVVF